MNFKDWLLTEMPENRFDFQGSEDDFIQHHKTGWIRSDAYADYEKEGGLSWLGGEEKYPIVIGIKQYGPHRVEFRQSGEKLKYVALDDDGEIKRNQSGLATYLSDDEIKKKELTPHNETIVAFVNRKPIGLASNEFGTIGVWVEGAYQKLGIGSDLMVMFMEKNNKFLSGRRKIGQMTNAGENMSRAAYKKLKQRYAT